MKDDKQIAIAPLTNDLYTINIQKICAISNEKYCIHQWHRIFGHRDINAIKNMIKIENLNTIQCTCNAFCDVCQEGKMTRKFFSKSKPIHSKAILDLVHTDLCGPMQTQTQSGKRYVLTFIDDYSRYTFIYLLREKNEVKIKIREFIELMKTQTGLKPKIFHSDRGGEYVNKDLKNYLKSEGIKMKFTPGYTPQLNGIAERKNRTLIEIARCLLIDAKLSKNFWGEAVNTANYIQNRLITRATNAIPYELWNNKKVYLNHLNLFGNYCYVKIPNQKRKKLDDSAELMILLGYDANNIFRCYDFKSNRVVYSRDIKFKKMNDPQEIEIPLET